MNTQIANSFNLTFTHSFDIPIAGDIFACGRRIIVGVQNVAENVIPGSRTSRLWKSIYIDQNHIKYVELGSKCSNLLKLY